MSIFKKSNNNISKTVRAQTVIVNGKVVSGNDPEAKAVMDDMQRGFSEKFSEGN
ncbi:hypothetical protein SAMN02745136_03203 [Anaerocolumna jejuensis DSM 15929]|uniref:Uncharacterized protein n=1 Tax=Anaerocolumna jejuensis DSM 15929 TaxID=1121322 RepID=A0A1M6UVG0_9FIRM|nr:hypothetical protein [Anaerocolumna jejuensis]SHK73188.1 hypothetical protein SAMN02745136_03203 [Anaerocolumna jejuensis DSM 15929]